MKKIYILLALFCCMGHCGFAQVAVTPATGGSAICGPLPSCTTLGDITITETNVADFSSGSDQITLVPPVGWQFCTVTCPSITAAPGGDITAVTGAGCFPTSMTFNITSGGTSNPDQITISGLMVQPLTSTSVPGSITASSVTGIAGITAGVTDFGDLALYPGQINGAVAVCAGNSTTLSDAATGGTWTSSSTGIATINPVSGLLTSITGTSGTTVITYSVSPGCSASVTFSVVTTPGPITGTTTSVCAGGSFIHLSDVTAGGAWSSSNTVVASVNASGTVIAGSAGTTIISYETSPLLSCASATSTVTVIGSPAAMTPSVTICTGNIITLSDATTGGTWSSSSTTVATVGLSSGTVLGNSTGTAIITYATGCGTAATTTVTVITAPGPITGQTSLCSGGVMITLSDDLAGGSWTSSNTGVAIIDPTAGTVTSTLPGTTVISYLTTCTAVTSTVTVLTIPGSIIGAGSSMCVGTTFTLSDATTGGTWSTGSTTIATVDMILGTVHGIAAGTALITYSTGCGASPVTGITVVAAPGPIAGVGPLCSGGAMLTLSDAISGGAWSSSVTTVAVVDPALGTVTSTLPGTTVITYSTGCGADATATITVLTIPGSIIGAGSSMCVGTTFTLSDATTGGTWSTGSTTIATVDMTLGTVHGIAAGTALITYSTGCGSSPVTGITVVAAPGPITGVGPLCSGGAMLTLSDAISGGAWSSSVTTVASVDPALGTVTSTLPGTTVITYSTGCGTDATTTITVLAIPGSITGAPTPLCVGASITLSDAVTGGTWSTNNTALATANPVTGQVYGIAAGAVTVSYSTGCGSPATFSGTVHALPGPILGGLTVCSGGSSITLSDAVTGGTWSSATTTIAIIGSTSGVVTSGIAGSTAITYTNVCGSSSATVIVPGATGAISPATASVCAGSGITLSDPTAGGTWSESLSSIALATVGSTTGVVSGVTGTSGGTVIITYSTGCAAVATATVTVIPTPLPITGTSTSVCSGGGILALSDAIAGGTWSSGTTAVATVGSVSGAVTGGTVGTAVITYSNGCGPAPTTTVTVISPPVAILPASSNLCAGGATETLSDGVSGGMWSSATTTVATVGSATGLVTSGVAGTTVISYSTGCGSAVSATVTVINGPTVISPVTAVVCTSATITLSDGTAGGSWSSSLSAVATVDPALGVVYGSTVGTVVISYSIGCGTAATRTVTVLGTPVAISPAVASICSGASITLSDATAGGTWMSSSTTVATVGSVSGVVTGTGTGGTTVITYSTGCGAAVTRSVTVTGIPVAISGLPSVCAGNNNITLSDAVPGGIWSTSVSAVATVGSASGVVTSGVAGNTVITYSTGCGSNATHSVTVLGTPVAISPAVASICSGANITLSDATVGGTWTSSNTTVATVGSVSGIVTGTGTGGTTLITYSTGCLAAATESVTVTGIPGAISGLPSVCSGNNNITLSDAVSGGIWSTSVSAVATVGSASGIVTSGVAGNTVITYSTGCGTDVTYSVTVLGTPVAISPAAASICSGANITLSDAITGGIWSSGTSAVATVGSASGIVTGGTTQGTSIITYSTGCGANATRTVTVTGIPGAISGLPSVCSGNNNITLSDAVPGGIWSTSVSTVATVGSASGVVTSGVAGNTVITYSTGCGTDATHSVTVLGTPVAISPAVASICSGANITLSDATVGGTWTSSNTTVATVGSVSGVVTGIGTGGTTLITYSTGCLAAVTRSVTVTGIPGAISGLTSVCSGNNNITLSDAVPGGTWSTSASAVATIGSASGIVTSGIAGTITITYGTSCASSSVTVTVLGTPVALNPTYTLCSTGSVTFSDATTGGTWSTNNSSVATVGSATGLVTGGTAGTARITYSTGCGANATTTVTVIGIAAAISPATAGICQGGNVTLSDATTSGTWSSSNTVIAAIGSANGFVTGGATTGTAIISYSTGCGAIATGTVNVLGVPDPISGLSPVCSASSITLSDDITGGTWSSGTTAVATVVAGTGVVTGGIGGTATITYSTGCGADVTTTVTVTAIPGVISGTLSACFGGGVTTLSDAITGGTWSSDNTAVATVDPALGVVTGGVPGAATISYSTSCGIASVTVTVSSSPGAITGASFVCPSSAVTLSDSPAGGAWSSSNTGIATVDPNLGIVTGATAGSATITYFTGCGAASVFSFTVNPLPAVPAAISGSAVVCTGSSITLSDATAGGVWSSGNTTIGTISSAGTLSTLTNGTVTVTYTVSNSCGNNSVSSAIVVDTLITAPAPIIGAVAVCQGATISLSDATASGVWSSSNTSIIVSPSGVCYGVAAGSSVISYTISNACSNASSVKSVTVMPLPSPAAITGYTDTLCAGSTVALSDASTGGVWSSNITTIAIVSGTGVVTAVSGGNSTIFYSMTNSCGTVAANIIVTVATFPAIDAVTGTTGVCTGNTTALNDATTGGVWSSSAPAIAAVGSTGIVTGVSAGLAVISYTKTYTCGVGSATALVTVSSIPSAGTITGNDYVCQGYTTILSDNVAGGVWSSTLLATAIVTSTGVVNGIATGSVTIEYTVTNGCGSATAILPMVVIEPTGGECLPPTAVNTVSATTTELKVFPNPNDGTFTLNLSSFAAEPVNVIITNLLGEKVKEITTATNTDTDITIGTQGIYFISTVTAHGKNMVKVVVK